MSWDRLPIVKLVKGIRTVFAHVFIDLPLWFAGFTNCQSCGRRISPREKVHVEYASGYDGTYEFHYCSECGGESA